MKTRPTLNAIAVAVLVVTLGGCANLMGWTARTANRHRTRTQPVGVALRQSGARSIW